MDKSGIIKFSDFFEKKNIKNTSESLYKSMEDEDISIDIDGKLQNESIEDNIDINISNFPHITKEESDKINDKIEKSYETYDDSEKSQDLMGELPVIESNENYYLVYKDKSEDFSCDIQLEGSNINDAKVRLILESNDWTLMFNGDIDNKGRCVIPIKKLGILNEGLVGKIRLEVIADDTIFTPWEDDFKVKVSKKVSVKVHESKSYRKSERSEIKVNVRK